jgi:hypothetical protein
MQSPVKVEESDVVDNLLEASTEFKCFYDTERPKAGNIEWYFDPHISSRFVSAEAAHISDLINNCQKICLKRLPVPVDDAHLVAHEILHAVFKDEKNQLIICECGAAYKSLQINIVRCSKILLSIRFCMKNTISIFQKIVSGNSPLSSGRGVIKRSQEIIFLK